MSAVSIVESQTLNTSSIFIANEEFVLRKRPKKEEKIVGEIASEVLNATEEKQPDHKRRKVELVSVEKVEEKKEALVLAEVTPLEENQPALKRRKIEEVPVSVKKSVTAVERVVVLPISTKEAKIQISQEIKNLQKLFGHKLNFKGKACLTGFKTALWMCSKEDSVAKLLQGVKSNIELHLNCFEEKEKEDAQAILSKIGNLINRLLKK